MLAKGHVHGLDEGMNKVTGVKLAALKGALRVPWGRYCRSAVVGHLENRDVSPTLQKFLNPLGPEQIAGGLDIVNGKGDAILANRDDIALLFGLGHFFTSLRVPDRDDNRYCRVSSPELFLWFA